MMERLVDHRRHRHRGPPDHDLGRGLVAARPVWRSPGTSKCQGLRFVVLEAGSELGHTWPDRWDTQVFTPAQYDGLPTQVFTPAQYDGLPGMPFPAPADTQPTKDLQTDVTAFDLPVPLNARVPLIQPSWFLPYVATSFPTY
jgi:hypothetical protein